MSFSVLSLTAVLLSSSTPAGQLHVPGTYATVQAAVNAAVAGDEVVIAPGTYNESFTLQGKAITVRSSGGADVTIFDGTGLVHSMVRAVSGETLATVVEGLTFVNGEGGPNQNCVSTDPAGGATYVGSGSALSLVDCVYMDNGLSGNVVEGAAVYVFHGSLRVEGCLFENNGVPGEGFGGAIGSCIDSASDSIEVTRSDFIGNGSAFGAGVRLGRFAEATIRDCTFTDNEASHGGGILSDTHYLYPSNLTVDGCVFTGNESSFGAGANISADRNELGSPSTVIVSDCEFVDNHAGFGGGLMLNFAMDTGLDGPDAEAYVTDCVFHGNLADACCNTGLYHTPCFVDGVGNGRYYGGAADIRTQYGGIIEIANCLVYDNDAVRAGGFHLATCSGGEVRLINSTIADNGKSGVHVRQDEEPFLQLPAGVLIANTIATGNGNAPDKQIIDQTVSLPQITFETRYSLVEGNFPGTGNIDGPPHFLAPELGEYCLEPGSRAIDAGDNNAVPAALGTDLEGLPRKVDDPATADTGAGSRPIVDMGAHEAQPGGCLLGTSYCGPAVPNSTGLPGVLRAIGSDVAGESLTLLASDLPLNQFGYAILSQTQGSSFPNGSSGELCLAGTIGRFNRSGEVGTTGAGGELTFEIDTTDIPLAPGFIQAGETWNFQVWHRDAGSTSNFTDGVEILFR